MDPLTPDQLEEAIWTQCQMRTGKSIGRTLYIILPEGDVCVGILDSPYIAHKLAMLWNASLGR